MMKFKMLLAMLVAVVLGTTVLAVPAYAEDGQHSARYCVAFDGAGGGIYRKEICAQVRWDPQADGTGVVLEFLDVDCEDGCSIINGLQNVNAKFHNGSNVKGSWNWGIEPSTFTKDHGSIRGLDDTWMIYHLEMCAEGDILWWNIRMYAGGNDDLVSQGHADSAQCPGGGGN